MPPSSSIDRTKPQQTPEDRCLKVQEFLSRHQLKKAENLCRQSLRIYPHHLNLKRLLGGICMLTHRPADAERLFREILNKEPEDPATLTNLGTVMMLTDRLAEAETAFQLALELRPNLAGTLDQLGQIYHAQQRLDDALAFYEKAIKADPDFKRPYARLAVIYLQKGLKAKALQALRIVGDGENGKAHAKAALGDFYLEEGLPGRAVQYLRDAGRKMPENVEILRKLADAYNQCGAADRAHPLLERVVHLKPENPQSYVNLSSNLTNLGRMEDAEDALNTALLLAPNHPGALCQLAQMDKITPESAETERMLSLVRNKHLPAGQRIAVHGGLARIFEKSGDYQLSFAHYSTAARLRRSVYEKNKQFYSREQTEKNIDLYLEVFTKKFFDERADWGNPSELPVFIGGVPRSGTTLTEQIIAAHPQAFGAGELMDIPRISDAAVRMTGRTKRAPRCLPLLTRDQVSHLAGQYLERLIKLSGGEVSKVSNKLPGNFMHMGLIALLFPNAPLIHCRRTPQDSLLSCFFTNFANGHLYSYDIGDLAHYWRQYHRIMEHWEEVLPGRILQVQYEETIADSEARSKEIIAHCGLEWDKACLSFHKVDRPIMTASKLQVRKPIYKTSVARWKRYEKWLGPMNDILAELG